MAPGVDGAIVNSAPLHDGSSVKESGTFTLMYHESTVERIETGGSSLAERSYLSIGQVVNLLRGNVSLPLQLKNTLP